jgi:DNA helicase IV
LISKWLLMVISNKKVGIIGSITGLIFIFTGLLLSTITNMAWAVWVAIGIIVTIMGISSFLKYFSVLTKRRQQVKNQLLKEYADLEGLVNQALNSGTYLVFTKKSNLLIKIKALLDKVGTLEKTSIVDQTFAQDLTTKLQVINISIQSYNPKFITQRKKEYGTLWKKGSICLDDEQQTAIITDDSYNLVIAGAGSGKTEVLITRIAYLIKRKPDGILPNRTLAIAFQRKAMEQIEERLFRRYNIQSVNVKTFHKLGKDILESSGHIIGKTDIVNDNKKSGFIKWFLENNMYTGSELYRLFVRYMKTVNNKDEEPTASDKRAVADYAKERQYVSINGTKVNSFAEKEIMDYLLTHKIGDKPIEVKYEPNLGGFNPDFYLPQFKIFIEHWGIDKDGNVPKWFSQSSEEYRNFMEKKKQWFKDNNKNLVETFAYEYNSHEPEVFLELLRTKLEQSLRKPLTLVPLTYEEILELVWQSQKTPIDDIQNFITVAKAYGFCPEDIAKRIIDSRWSDKQRAFASLAHFIFQAYEVQLKKTGKIDFEDMINEAIKALDNDPSLCRNIYDQILVDEYQDISAQRLKLLKVLIQRNSNCKLFCVGDDWQSIMGFSGSNLNFFVNFASYFSNPAVNRISTNYRSIKSIVDTGAEVIKNNGIKQVQKTVLSNRKETKPILILDSPHKDGYDKQYFRQISEDCLNRIKYYLEIGYAPDDILVLTRFMRTKILGRQRYFKVVETFSYMAKDMGLNIAIDNVKQPNAVKLLTIHKCKGLEAKVVFVLNVIKGEFGFPSEIEDSTILEVARGDNGIENQIEEERRLFYVALTRAKDYLYIYTRENSKSVFLNEISKASLPYIQNVRLGYNITSK